MKNTRKFAAMIAALTLSACSIAPMAMTASAAENKITFTGEQAGTHSYSVYKIFDGVASDNGMNTATGAELNNLEWSVNEDVQKALVVALKANDTLKTDFASFSDTEAPSVADFAAVVGDFEANSAKAKAFAETVVKVFNENNVNATATGGGEEGITLNSDGYYVIAETGVDMEENDEYTGMTAYLLGVYDASAGAAVTVKSSAPSFQKKLRDTNDTTGETTGWQDSADYDIGDDVPFQLKATLPSTYADYKAYKLTFHDNFRNVNSGEESVEVFTFKQIDKIYVDANGNGKFDDGDVDVTAKYSKSDSSVTDYDFDVTINNLKNDYAPETTPADAAVIVEYSATLNVNAVIGSAGNWNDAYLSYTTNPNWNGTPDEEDTPDEEKEHPKDSPVDTTVVFTYQTVINKVNPQGTSLKGANFTLAKRYAVAPEDKEEFVVGEGESAVTYYVVSKITDIDKDSFEFKGLDDGDYILVETKAPDNYKIATKPVYFTISAEHTNDPEILKLTSLTGAATEGALDDGFINLQADDDGNRMTSDIKEGKIEANFINTSGAELPSTGGMGTKLFYLGGGAMVAVAGVFLITKKRMGRSEN
ncbi:MAG: isopeptide-forming domain-containing fimbrial protein [Ruminococcus sp.]|nr:isopeptide-forming domain-containing fimbrial protein [Ruminococcus sp.]